MVLKKRKILRTFIEKGYAKKTAHVVLALVAIGAVAGTAIIAPNVLQIIGSFTRRRGNFQVNPKYRTQQTLWGLRRSGYIRVRKAQECFGSIILTRKGERHLMKCMIEAVGLKMPKCWDRKFWFVLFDIPASRRNVRDALRFYLRRLGFMQYQKSVWVHPAPCKEEIAFLRDYFSLRSGVRVISARSEGVEDATRIKTFFHLSSL